MEDVLGNHTFAHNKSSKEEKEDSNFSCLSCARIPELDQVNGFFGENEVVKFKLRGAGSAIEWGKEQVLCIPCDEFMKKVGVERSVLLNPEWKLW